MTRSCIALYYLHAMRFLGQLALLVCIVALLFGVVAAGLSIAAYGTWALEHPGKGTLPLTPAQALAVVLAGGLLVLVTPVVAGGIGSPGNRRRYGLFAFMAGLPDLAIAWTYVAALVAPLLIDAGRKLMAVLLAAEFFASYTTIMLVSLAETERTRGHSGAMLGKLGVVVVTLAFVGAASVWAGSWVPVAAYFALAGKRIVMGLLEPERTPASLSEHQYHRCMLPLAMLVFIGVPLFFYSKSLEAMLVLGALNFAFMAILETVLHARRGR